MGKGKKAKKSKPVPRLVITLPDRVIAPLVGGGEREMSSDEYLDGLEAQARRLRGLGPR